MMDGVLKFEMRFIEGEKLIADRNFKSLMENGCGYTRMQYVRVWGMKHPIEMLRWMLELYEELEEFEKCATLKKIMDLPENFTILSTYEIPDSYQL